jgi:UDP-N-acetylglucosamine:LPS N-acetylglucosamine transferase
MTRDDVLTHAFGYARPVTRRAAPFGADVDGSGALLRHRPGRNDSKTARGGKKPRRALAVASAGGHLMELRRIRHVFDGMDVIWLTTDIAFAKDIAADAAAAGAPEPVVRAVPEASLWNKRHLLHQMIAVGVALFRLRPDVVVTTGAAPGYFAVLFGRMLGARTIFIDSIANAEELSKSGRWAGRHADLLLTQWPHLVDSLGPGRGPIYIGAVL